MNRFTCYIPDVVRKVADSLTISSSGTDHITYCEIGKLYIDS